MTEPGKVKIYTVCTRRQILRGMARTAQRRSQKAGIDFFSTPFDKSAVDFLEDLGVEFYKIASFEL